MRTMTAAFCAFALLWACAASAKAPAKAKGRTSGPKTKTEAADPRAGRKFGECPKDASRKLIYNEWVKPADCKCDACTIDFGTACGPKSKKPGADFLCCKVVCE